MSRLKKLLRHLKAKGFLDTVDLCWHIATGVFDYYLNPFAKRKSSLAPPDHERIRDGLEAAGLTLIPYKIDVCRFQEWLRKAHFPKQYVTSCGKVFIEKALEHYIGARLLELRTEDVLIDVAAAHSPWFEMAERMYGCTAYALDLAFPAGINDKKIGADATSMPLPDNFASKIALHCAYETFEGDADIRLLPEVKRVLRTSGKMVIVPLYLDNIYFVDSSPLADRRHIDYQGAEMFWRDDKYIVRCSRKYSVEAFVKRVAGNLDGLRLKIYYMENEKQVDGTCYLKFAAVFEK